MKRTFSIIVVAVLCVVFTVSASVSQVSEQKLKELSVDFTQWVWILLHEKVGGVIQYGPMIRIDGGVRPDASGDSWSNQYITRAHVQKEYGPLVGVGAEISIHGAPRDYEVKLIRDHYSACQRAEQGQKNAKMCRSLSIPIADLLYSLGVRDVAVREFPTIINGKQIGGSISAVGKLNGTDVMVNIVYSEDDNLSKDYDFAVMESGDIFLKRIDAYDQKVAKETAQGPAKPARATGANYLYSSGGDFDFGLPVGQCEKESPTFDETEYISEFIEKDYGWEGFKVSSVESCNYGEHQDMIITLTRGDYEEGGGPTEATVNMISSSSPAYLARQNFSDFVEANEIQYGGGLIIPEFRKMIAATNFYGGNTSKFKTVKGNNGQIKSVAAVLENPGGVELYMEMKINFN